MLTSIFSFCRNHLFRLNLEDLTLIQVSSIYHSPGPLVLASCVWDSHTLASVCSLPFTLPGSAQTWCLAILEELMN